MKQVKELICINYVLAKVNMHTFKLNCLSPKKFLHDLTSDGTRRLLAKDINMKRNFILKRFKFLELYYKQLIPNDYWWNRSYNTKKKGCMLLKIKQKSLWNSLEGFLGVKNSILPRSKESTVGINPNCSRKIKLIQVTNNRTILWIKSISGIQDACRILFH